MARNTLLFVAVFAVIIGGVSSFALPSSTADPALSSSTVDPSLSSSTVDPAVALSSSTADPSLSSSTVDPSSSTADPALSSSTVDPSLSSSTADPSSSTVDPAVALSSSTADPSLSSSTTDPSLSSSTADPAVTLSSSTADPSSSTANPSLSSGTANPSSSTADPSSSTTDPAVTLSSSTADPTVAASPNTVASSSSPVVTGSNAFAPFKEGNNFHSGPAFEVVSTESPDQFHRVVSNDKVAYVIYPAQTKDNKYLYDPWTIGQVLGYLHELAEFGPNPPKGFQYTIDLMSKGPIPKSWKKKRNAQKLRRATLVFTKKEKKSAPPPHLEELEEPVMLNKNEKYWDGVLDNVWEDYSV